MLSLLLASLLGGTRPVAAEAFTGPMPELDSLSVRILIDSYQFAVAPSRKIGSLAIEHFGWGIAPDRHQALPWRVNSACLCMSPHSAVMKLAASW